MTENNPTVTCEVVCDLMVIYASGEASPETVAFIEAHLEECPECAEAYEAAKRGEDLLAELGPVERPIQIDGRKILLRLQRVFFGLSTLVLLLAALGIAIFERIIVQGVFGLRLPSLYVLGGLEGGVEWIAAASVLLVLFGLFHYWRSSRAQDPDSPFLALIGAALLFVAGLAGYKFMVQGDLPGTIVAGTLLFAVYIFMLRWRTQQADSGRFLGGGALSFEAAVPLFILVLATLTLISSVSFTAGAFSLALLVVALFITLVYLDRLPYMTLLTLLGLFAGGIMLLANAAGGFATLFDLTVDRPTDLGHPDDLPVSINLDSLGYDPLDTAQIESLDGLEHTDFEGWRTVYTRSGGGPAAVTVLRFVDGGDAAAAFRIWERSVDNDFYAIHLDLNAAQFDEPDGYADHPLHWDLELPGAWFGQEGQIARSYDEGDLAAYNAWQIDEWITIVEVQGSVTQAIPLSRQIKEAVAAVYDR